MAGERYEVPHLSAILADRMAWEERRAAQPFEYERLLVHTRSHIQQQLDILRHLCAVVDEGRHPGASTVYSAIPVGVQKVERDRPPRLTFLQLVCDGFVPSFTLQICAPEDVVDHSLDPIAAPLYGVVDYVHVDIGVRPSLAVLEETQALDALLGVAVEAASHSVAEKGLDRG